MGQHLYNLVVFGIVFLTSETLARPAPEQVRCATGDYIRKDQQQEGIDYFTSVLANQLKDSVQVGTDRLVLYSTLADCVRLMELSCETPIPEGVLDWVLASGKRVHLLVETIAPEDRLAECMTIMDELGRSDVAGRDKYYELILAMAVIWDSPQRPAMHGQMGGQPLAYTADIAKRYAYFKQLFESGAAKIPYSELSIYDLIFVVDTPVPVSELQWARKSVEGSINSWGDKFQEIVYDTARLEEEVYNWPNGAYTLASIRKLGGICVDQTYYCVMTARAFGIPALYFSAVGSGGGHAWFSYMRSAGKWELGVGRYENQGYTTGNTVNPQTGRPMTDHDVEFACERSRNSAERSKAELYTTIAEVLRARDASVALQCARTSRKLFPRDLRPWNTELMLLTEAKDFDGMITLFHDQKDVFRRYPDILADMASRIQQVLESEGRTADAEKLAKSLSGAVDDDRDDIGRSMEISRIMQLFESGENKTALREFEQLLEDQMEQGSKVLPLLTYYLEMAKKNGLENDAVDFLEDYVEDILDKERILPYWERGFLSVLLDGYLCVGDEDNAREIQKLIEESAASN